MKASFLPHLLKIEEEISKYKKSKTPRRSKIMSSLVYAYVKATMRSVEPTKSELRAIKEGREEFERGEFITLEDWENELARNSNKKNKKKSR